MAEPKRPPELSASSLLPLKPHPTPQIPFLGKGERTQPGSAGACWRRGGGEWGTGGQTMHGAGNGGAERDG